MRRPAVTSVDAETDVLVVGAGVAGAATALAAAAAGRRVSVLVKGRLGEGATAWAQGGLAAVLDPGDSCEDHLRDTMLAGAGLCEEDAVRTLVDAAPDAIVALQRVGVRFDPSGLDGGRLALGREGGHRASRIVHAGGDATGPRITAALTAALLRTPGIVVRQQVVAVDPLLDAAGQVVGVRAAQLDARGSMVAVGQIRARAVVLATGGLGQAYATTSNPPGATGDGLVLALRAGASLMDVEFVQFHPTVFWRAAGARGQQPLISEAVRGEGAVLVDGAGHRVMLGAHPMADLAPRDVVSAAIHARLAQAPGGVGDHVWLDATALGERFLQRRFPTIVTACRAAGVDPGREPIPVAPGAHYACGGVHADLHGRTGVTGLFAVGEVAGTGVQGANRLASNSLTEGFVAGDLAGQVLGRELPPPGGEPVALPAPERHVVTDSRPGTAEAMARWAGVVRSQQGLQQLMSHLAQVPDGAAPTTLAAYEANTLHQVSTLVATAALARQESRGCHRRADFAGPSSSEGHHQVLRLADGALHSAVRAPRVPA